jgi:cation diffusion facilitator family transporter
VRTSYFDTGLSTLAPIAFLVAAHFYRRHPSPSFPYGYHRVVSVGYLAGSLALLITGVFLTYQASTELIAMHHTTIGAVTLFGRTFWFGWLMIVAILYDAIPATILGYMKLPLARQLHDKALFADAETNKAAWQSDLAALVGVVGVGLGYWWADAAAALLISLNIAYDGFKNVRAAVSDLMNRVPEEVGAEKKDPLIEEVATTLNGLPWVRESTIRLREEGHVYFGEAYVVPIDEDNLVARIEEATEKVIDLNWRVHDFVITPVSELPAEQPRAEKSVEEES